MKKLMIITDGSGIYDYELSDGGKSGSGAPGVTWGEIEKVVAGMAPSARADRIRAAMASGQSQAGAFSVQMRAPVNTELRLECVRLAIAAGVPHDRVFGWADGLEKQVTRQGA